MPQQNIGYDSIDALRSKRQRAPLAKTGGGKMKVEELSQRGLKTVGRGRIVDEEDRRKVRLEVAGSAELRWTFTALVRKDRAKGIA